MIIERLEVGVFAENCYVVGCEITSEGVVIDPGDEVARILKSIAELKLKIKYILLTHAHLDHVKEVTATQKALAVPVMMHRADQFLLDNLPAQAAAFGLTTSGIPRVDKYIEEGEQIEFGRHRFEVLHTPGHSPGSVTFAEKGVAFVGDLLFAGSIGRTDLPGGDYETLIRSVKSKLFPLGDDTRVYSGHGPQTTIGQEKQTNPFLI
jgi:glyoxylase-like metal-dependent hydrolase (beta-lactamase superfamily II)